ncbi:FtsQ-type POTRA domain-containing protein [Ferruginibacter sp. SUN106]|uniref:cell division protein FtsQ/DivIB n=1 Tax=Ferruginibacter sp. SUN106 TaxID=2978348 RepID=UPI003D3645FB
MNEKKRYSIKKILLAVLWVTIGTGTTVLLVAGINKKDAAKCKGVAIKISGIENTDGPKFVDEEDILNTIQKISNGNAKGKAIGTFNLQKIEIELEKSKWVKNAELFFDNNDSLKVNLQEREPVARIFTTGNMSFYIDTALAMLPLSDKFSARLPVFTGFPTDQIVLSTADSSLLNDVKVISLAIQKDSFRMAMIDQVDITPERNFEMIPKIGNQLIVFGDATAAEDKFNKLELFYKEVMVKSGWSKYSVINVQYKGQVVARRRGAEDKTADSVRTLQIMQLIAANAAQQAEDSLQTILQDNNNNTADSSMIQQSIQREDNVETNNAINESPLKPLNNQPAEKPVNSNPLPPVKPAAAKPAVPNPIPVKKPMPAKPAATKPNPVLPKKPATNPVKPKPAVTKPPAGKPKVVMPNKPIKNDY